MIITDRLKEAIQRAYDGNVKAFARKCAEIDRENAPSYEAVRNYIAGSMPGLDKAVIMAKAAGVTLDWMAGVEENNNRHRPKPTGTHDLFRTEWAPGQQQLSSVEPGNVPVAPSMKPGFVFRAFGQDLLAVDFVVQGRGDRLEIPIDVESRIPEAIRGT